MAYFANGTEGLYLEEQCDSCIHGADESQSIMCPIYLVQQEYNYKQNDDGDLRDCLNHLINNQGVCQMKRTLDKMGVKFDTSWQNQGGLFK